MSSAKTLSPDSTLLERIVPADELSKLQDFIASLEAPIGTEAFELPEKARLDLPTEGMLKLFDQPLAVGGKLSTDASFLGSAAAVDPFGVGDVRPLREGFNSGRFEVATKLGLDADTTLASGSSGLELSAKAAVSGKFKYRHWVAAKPDWSRARAFRELIFDSRLPSHLDLRTPPDIGAVHRLDAKLKLDFGLDFKTGYDVAADLTLNIAGGLSLPFKTSFAATLQAALGLGLYEEMSLAVGRVHQLEEGWIRVRLQRQSERKLSFGVTFSLDIKYDLGTGLAQIFEEALDDVPTKRLVDAARKIAEYSDLETLKAKAEGEVSEVIDDWIGTKIVDGLDGVIPFARHVTSAWDSLDERVQSLWERVLAHADLGPGSRTRQWLEELEKLKDGVDVDALLKDDALRDLVDAIEAVSGKSLEELLLDETGLGEALEEVAEVASKALGFLDGVPGDVARKIQEFTAKTGIAAAVAVLRHVDSKDKLQEEVSGHIQKLAAKIVGKSVDLFKQEDLDKIKSWAERMAGLLDPGDPTGEAVKFKRRIAAELQKLKLDCGFSLSFEVDRISRHTALLDLELSHRQDAVKLRRKVSEALREGKAQKILEALAEDGGMIEKPSASDAVASDDAPTPHFLLRECVFTSERIRTSAVSAVLDVVGLGRLLSSKERGFTRRLEHSTVRVVDRKLTDAPQIGDEDPQRFERQGRYSAGYSRGERTRDLDTETSIWLVSEDKGFGADLEGAYTHDRQRSLRLAFSWEDDASNQQEIGALYRLLGQLGFTPAATTAGDEALPTTAEALLERGQAVRLGFAIRFADEAVAQVLDGVRSDTTWQRAFLNACYRWLAEAFVTRPRLPGPAQNTHNLGQVMARILAHSPDIRKRLVDSDFWSDMGGKSIEVHFENGENVSFPVGRLDSPEPLTGILQSIVAHDQRGATALRRLDTAWDAATSERTPAAYADLSERFSNGWRTASIATLRWPSSMFAAWLFLALLELAAPGELAKATGVATLRWREGGAADEDPPWTEPMFWRLENGVPALLGRLDVFPVP